MTGISSTGKNNPVVKTEQHPDDPLGWRAPVRASRVKFDEEQKLKYLDILKLTGNKIKAREAAGVHRNTIFNHRKSDPDFSDAEDNALESYSAEITTRIEREALEGHTEKITREDGSTIERKILESGIRAMMLKGHDPERYNPKTELDVNVNGGGGVLVVPFPVSKEEWIALYAPKDEPPKELETFEDV